MEESDSGSPLSLLPPAEDSPAGTAYHSLTARFLQEAWVTGGLEHPGIVPVYELGRTPAGVPYYTMRFISGKRTLDSAITGASGLTDRLALLEPFLKICDTMSYAHSRGVVHRDLKPANVALGDFGEVVVLDWGLARLEDRPDLTEAHWRSRLREFRESIDLETAVGALGTPGYMSPEAAAGESDRLDQRSDVYSLGVILFVLLTGRLPFQFKSFLDFVSRIRRESPPDPRQLEPGAPAGLAAICLRALAREKDDRISSAGELAALIRTWQRESALEREVEVLRSEARAGLRSAEGLRGDALLRQVEQILAACAGVLRLREEDEVAREILGSCETLRRRAVEEQTRDSRKVQLRRLSLVGALFLIIAAGTVLWLFDSRRQVAEAGERTANALALVSAAREAAVTDPMLGLLLVRQAARVELLPEVMSALCDLLVNTREKSMIAGHEAWVQSAVYSPQGDRILTASGDHTARLWDREGCELVRFTGHEGAVTAAPPARQMLSE